MNTFKPFGDQALLINFEQKIDSSINDSVIELVSKIQKASIIGITFLTPAYCSLTVGLIQIKPILKRFARKSFHYRKKKLAILDQRIEPFLIFPFAIPLHIQLIFKQSFIKPVFQNQK